MSGWGPRLSIAVEELVDEGRLRRGRALARDGHVHDLRVEPGRVSAQVQGSDPVPYTASFLLAPLIDADATRVRERLDGDPVLLAELAAGELPVELGEPRYGLFPSYADELDFECTCPDWRRPCKHAAALVHALVGVGTGGAGGGGAKALLRLRGVDVTPSPGPGGPGAEPAGPGAEAAGPGAEAAGPGAEAARTDDGAHRLNAWFAATGAVGVPPVEFRPATDDLDPQLLWAALEASATAPGSAERATEWLHDAYLRLG